jgi:ligand-binding sensor domain-containing protein
MRYSFLFVLLTLIGYHPAFSLDSEWMTFTDTRSVLTVLEQGDFIWAGTMEGLVRLSKNTGEMTFFNRANSGLPDNKILSLEMYGDELLVGTEQGLAIYTGTQWETYTALNSGIPMPYPIYSITIDSLRRIWLAVGDIACAISRNGELIDSFTTGNPIAANPQICDLNVDSKNNVWIGAFWGLGWIDSLGLHKYSPMAGRQINCLHVDKSDKVYMGTDAFGLIAFDGQSTIVFDTSNSDIPNNRIHSISADSGSNLWIATPFKQCKYNGTIWEIFDTANTGLPKCGALTIYIDEQQDIVWFGQWNGGLLKYDGTTWLPIETAQTPIIKYQDKRAIASNEPGSIWLAQNCLLHYNINLDQWETFAPDNLEPLNNRFDLILDSAKTKVWTGENIIVSLQDSIDWYLENTSNTHTGSKLKKDNAGNIWLAKNNGLWKYNGSSWKVFDTAQTPFHDNYITEFSFDNKGNLYLAASGLYRYDGFTWSTLLNAMPDSAVSAIEIDSSGNVWVGLYRGGLKKYNGITWTSYNTVNSKLPSNAVLELCLDNSDGLWIGTNGSGCVFFDGINQWQTYNRNNSRLPDNGIIYIEVDSTDNKWIWTEFGGLAVYKEGGIINAESSAHNLSLSQSGITLGQNTPNPFTGTTVIPLVLANSHSQIQINVYDIFGRHVKSIVENQVSKGKHKAIWNGTNHLNQKVPSGQYFYVIKENDKIITKKMTFIR